MSSEAKLILRLEARTAKFEKDLSKAINKLDGNVKRGNRAFDKGMTKMERRAKRFTSNLSRTLSSVSGLGTIGIGASLGIGAKTLAEFSQSMSTVAAVTGATSSEFEALELKARDLGATTRFSAAQAAEGMVALGRAGFDTNQVLGSIEGTLLLAQSGALELGSAADIASNVLQGFRLDASEAGRAVDVLSLAANSSNTDVEQLGQALSFVAPASASVGITMEETAAAISALSDAGIQGTRAGTGLRHILIELAAGGTDLRKEAGGLQGALQSLADQNLDLAAAADLVGNRQAASLLVLLDSVEKVGKLDKAYENASGSAANAARIMDDNLNGALLATKSRLQEVAIAMGEAGSEQALIDGLGELQELLVFVAENADTFTKAVIVMSAASAGLISAKAIGGVITVLGKARTSMLATAAMSNTTALSLKGLTASARGLMVALGPLGWVAIAAGAVAAFAQFGGAAKSANQDIDDFDGTLADLNKTNKALQTDTQKLEQLTRDLADANDEVGKAAHSARILEIGALNARIAKNQQLAETYKTLLRAQISSGQASAARAGQKQLGLTKVFAQTDDEFREKRQEGLNKLLREANEAAAKGELLTKKQTKALELQVEQAEQLAKVEAARAQLAALDDAPARAKAAAAAALAKAEADAAEDKVKADAARASSAAAALAEKAEKFEKENARELEAIAELGKTEREQIAELLKLRLSTIEQSSRAEVEKEQLRKKAHIAAKEDLAEVAKAEADLAAKASQDIADAKADREAAAASALAFRRDELGYLAEIEAANARSTGRALEATRIELDAVKARYAAELALIDEIIAKKGASPELLADRANAQAGIASTDLAITDANNSALRDFDDLTSDTSDQLGFELARIDEIETAKMERLEELRTSELEALRDFEAQKSAIEMEADLARQEARFASMKTQLATTEDLLSGITSALQSAGKENTKAAKIAAKAQQIVALSNAVVNTAQGVTSALATGNIPKAILVGALGALQVGVIASQTFDGGGRTSNGARVGGVDGKGGYHAIVHPNETIVDHSKPGREVAGKSIEEAFGLSPRASLGRGPGRGVLKGVAASRESSSYRGGDFIVQGNVEENAIPSLKAEMARFRKNQQTDFERMSDARERRTTSRNERRVGRGR